MEKADTSFNVLQRPSAHMGEVAGKSLGVSSWQKSDYPPVNHPAKIIKKYDWELKQWTRI